MDCEITPTDTEAFLNAGLSFSESPRYNMPPPLLNTLFLIFRISETTRSNAIPLLRYSA